MSSHRILWQSHVGFPCLYRSGQMWISAIFLIILKKISWKNLHMWLAGGLGCWGFVPLSPKLENFSLHGQLTAFRNTLFAFECALALSLIPLPLEGNLYIFTFLVITRSLLERGQKGPCSLTGAFATIPLMLFVMTPCILVISNNSLQGPCGWICLGILCFVAIYT